MKVLIVDDELGIIEMIKNITPWGSLGITEILTAVDGKTGLEMTEQHRPDILITDIEMPAMDGITMAEHIVDGSDHAPEIIFLTCHAEFHYAQRAIRCGVTDYLLKPFFPEVLTAVLSKAVVRRRQKNSAEPEPDTQFYLQRSFLRDILNHVYDGDASRLQWAARKRDVSLDVREKRVMVAVGIPIEDALKQYTKSQLLFMFGNVCREILFGLENIDNSLMVDYTARNYYTAYFFLEMQNPQGIAEKCSRLGAALRQYLQVAATCVISEDITIFQYAEVRDRMEALLGRTVGDTSSVLFLKDAESSRGIQQTDINKQLMLGYLRERKKSELLLYMRHFLEQSFSQREMKSIYQNVTQVFYGYLYENRIDTTSFFQDEMSRKISEAAEDSAMNMMKFVSYLYDSVLSHIEELKKSSTVTQRAKQFIAEHYMENIGRTEIAQEVMLAPNYLSMLFHKETGQTIREYINLCRVEEAKKIMTVTNDSVTEVAMQVGFDNISYFSTVFKKYTGVSPAEYRHNLRQNQEGEP